MVTKRPSAIELMLEKKTAGVKERIDNRTGPSIADKPPVTMPGQLGAFRLEAKQYQERIKELENQLKEAKDAGGSLDLPLDQLVEIEGRRRQLSPVAYTELKENLRQHELVTPISVRVMEDGRYEIVSGHNRVAIYRELGRRTIKAWLSETDADKTEELAFYANLLHPDLPAFEKFIGLKRILDSNPGQKMSQQELAVRTGITRSTIAELLKFEDLPQQAKEILVQKPDAIGARAAAKLAALAAQGNELAVIEAIRKIANENITENEAILLAAGRPAFPRTGKEEALRIKSGRNTYCVVRPAARYLKLEFQSENDRAEIEAKILALLEEHAHQKKVS